MLRLCSLLALFLVHISSDPLEKSAEGLSGRVPYLSSLLGKLDLFADDPDLPSVDDLRDKLMGKCDSKTCQDISDDLDDFDRKLSQGGESIMSLMDDLNSITQLVDPCGSFLMNKNRWKRDLGAPEAEAAKNESGFQDRKKVDEELLRALLKSSGVGSSRREDVHIEPEPRMMPMPDKGSEGVPWEIFIPLLLKLISPGGFGAYGGQQGGYTDPCTSKIAEPCCSRGGDSSFNIFDGAILIETK